MPAFRTPRRQPMRPPSEPVERDDDAVVDAGAVRETAFVSQVLTDIAIHVPGQRSVRRTFGAPSPFGPVRAPVAGDEDDQIRAMSDAEFEAWMMAEHGFSRGHFMYDAYRAVRK